MVKGAVSSTVRIATGLLRVVGSGGYIKASLFNKRGIEIHCRSIQFLVFLFNFSPQIILFSLSLILFSLPFFLNPNSPHARRIPLPGVEGPDMDI